MPTPRIRELAACSERLDRMSLKSSSIEEIKEQIKTILVDYEPLAVTRSKEQIWHRGRICENGQPFANLHEMIYPPAGCRGYGRAQVPKSKVIYAGWNETVALDEISAKSGDLVQLIMMRPILDAQVPCHIVGEYEGFFRSGRSPIHTGLLQIKLEEMSRHHKNKFTECVFIDCLIADRFRRQVRVDWQYKPTAAYAEIFHATNGGIIYPSVKNYGTFNLALNASVFDRQFEVIATSVKRVTSFGYGFYSDMVTHASVDFDVDGKINWNSSKRREFEWNAQNGFREKHPYPGWQKPPSKSSSKQVVPVR